MNDKSGHVLPHVTAQNCIDENEMLKCGLTVKEYNSLSDGEREELWKQEYQRQLKTLETEMEVNPHVLSARQGRRPEDVRRLEQLRKRQSTYDGWTPCD